MLRAQHWAARGYDLSKKRLCSTRTVRAPVPPLSARVAGQGCLLGLRHGACPGAVLNTLQAIALDATRRLHPLALSSIVSTLALLGVSTLRATPAQALTPAGLRTVIARVQESAREFGGSQLAAAAGEFFRGETKGN